MCSDFSLDGFSPTYYTVFPMLSASGNLFKCHEEVLFYFFTCCIGIPIIVYPEYFVCRGGGDWYSYIVYPYYTVYPMLSAWWGNLLKCH